MTSLYTIFNTAGEKLESGLTLAETAMAVMYYDGHTYEIRPAEDGMGFELWTSLFSLNSFGGNNSMTKSNIYSFLADYAGAETEIFQKVCDNSEWWKNQVVMLEGEI